jgi:hypothetical protein
MAVFPPQHWTDVLDDAAIARIAPAIVKTEYFWGLPDHGDAVKVATAMARATIPYTFSVDGKIVGENWVWDYRDRQRFDTPRDAWVMWDLEHIVTGYPSRRCACPPATTKARKR